jgi:hypothetical protein
MADQELKRGPGLVAGGFEQGAAGDRRTMDGGQIGVVGFVAGVDGNAVLLGDEGMENACLETGGGEVTLHGAVIAAGAFDGHDAVAELVLLEGVADLSDRVVETDPGVLDGSGWNEDAAVEVGEQEFGACFSAVEAEDAEVFGSDQLDARVKHPARLADRLNL